MWRTVLVILLQAPLILYFGLKYYYNYWKRKQIPYVPSNVLDFDWFNLPQVEHVAKIYRLLKGHEFGGLYAKFAPKLMILDPKLINHILLKDFDHFHSRGDLAFDESEPITMHMFSAPGPVWRKLRTKLTPTFTSAKMKLMFSLVEECVKEFSEAIGKRIETSNTIDVKGFSTHYMIEVISSCAFGLKADTIREGDSVFKRMALNVLARSLPARFASMTRSVFPKLKKIFRISVINKPVTKFFYELIRNTVDYRKTNTVNRNDFLQLLMDIRDDDKLTSEKPGQEKLGTTDELMTAQCFLFFVAGFDTSSMTLIAALYELATHSDIQKKLQDEIEEYMQIYQDKIGYEMVKNMPYLNRIVSGNYFNSLKRRKKANENTTSDFAWIDNQKNAEHPLNLVRIFFTETLRKYPVLAALNRVCVHRYKIPNTEVFIEKGTEVLIPVSGLHSDPEYFPNPDQFEPDRFKDPNADFIRNTYLPFGGGPRNCIGSRFAQMSIKLALVHLFRDFNFAPCPTTPSSFEFERLKLTTSVKHEIFLKCNKKRPACS